LVGLTVHVGGCVVVGVVGDGDGGNVVGVVGDGVMVEVEPVTMRATPTCAFPPLEVIAIVPA